MRAPTATCGADGMSGVDVLRAGRTGVLRPNDGRRGAGGNISEAIVWVLAVGVVLFFDLHVLER